MAASRRVSELLETGQARAMLSSPKDMEACPRVRTLEDSLREGVAAMSRVGSLRPEVVAACTHVLAD